MNALMQNKRLVWWSSAILLVALPIILQLFGNAWVRIADVALL